MQEKTVGIHLHFPIRGVRPGKFKEEAFSAVRREAVTVRAFSGDEVPLVARLDGDYRGNTMHWFDRSMGDEHKTDLRHLDGKFYRRAWVARTGEKRSATYRTGEILSDERGTSIVGESYDAHWLKTFVSADDPRLRYGPDRVARTAHAEVMTEADLMALLTAGVIRSDWGRQMNIFAFPDPDLLVAEKAEEMPVVRKVTSDHGVHHHAYVQQTLDGMVVVDGEVWRQVAEPAYCIDLDRSSAEISIIPAAWAYESGKTLCYPLSEFDAARDMSDRIAETNGWKISREQAIGPQEIIDPSVFSIDMKKVIAGLGVSGFDMREGMEWRRGSGAARPLQFLHSAGREGIRSWMTFRDAVANPSATVEDQAMALADFYDRCGSIGQYHHAFENALVLLDRLGLRDRPAIKAEERAAKEAWNQEFAR